MKCSSRHTFAPTDLIFGASITSNFCPWSQVSGGPLLPIREEVWPFPLYPGMQTVALREIQLPPFHLFSAFAWAAGFVCWHSIQRALRHQLPHWSATQSWCCPYFKVHLTPKYFFRSNKSLHLFEMLCAFLRLFNSNLDFLQAVKVTKPGHHLLRCKSVCDVHPGIDPYPLLARLCNR